MFRLQEWLLRVPLLFLGNRLPQLKFRFFRKELKFLSGILIYDTVVYVQNTLLLILPRFIPLLATIFTKENVTLPLCYPHNALMSLERMILAGCQVGGHVQKGGKEDIFTGKGGQKEDIFY